jgi:hypothetical protein
MANGESRIAALQYAGFEIKSPLPAEYEAVIEGLSDDELQMLVNLKRRLDEAETQTAPEVGSYREYFVPF